jgi:hypothetical protein
MYRNALPVPTGPNEAGLARRGRCAPALATSKHPALSFHTREITATASQRTSWQLAPQVPKPAVFGHAPRPLPRATSSSNRWIADSNPCLCNRRVLRVSAPRAAVPDLARSRSETLEHVGPASVSLRVLLATLGITRAGRVVALAPAVGRIEASPTRSCDAGRRSDKSDGAQSTRGGRYER